MRCISVVMVEFYFLTWMGVYMSVLSCDNSLSAEERVWKQFCRRRFIKCRRKEKLTVMKRSRPSPVLLPSISWERSLGKSDTRQIPARTQTLKQTQRLRKSITRDKRSFPDLSRVITKATRSSLLRARRKGKEKINKNIVTSQFLSAWSSDSTGPPGTRHT